MPQRALIPRVTAAVTDESEKIWRDIIIDHSQFPQRHGQLEHASHEGHGENPFCGDRIHLQMRIEASGSISDVKYEASGCAISLASASLLSSNLKGKDVQQAQRLFKRVHELLTGKSDQANADLGELEALVLIRQYPSRVKCATLAWHVMRHALKGDSEMVTTE